MATYKQGILGGFSGKVGTVIGSYWKGRCVMRAVPNHVTNPQTPAQMEQRAKWALVSHFLSTVLGYVNIGYRNYASTETQANAAMRDNLANAVTGSGTSPQIDLDRVSLSKGPLLNIDTPSCSAGSSHSVTVTWTDNTGAAVDALATDAVMVCLYNAAKASSTYDTSAVREDATLSIAHPSGWAGDTLTVYAFTQSADGATTSNTVKVGTVTAA